jgi:hypothetical protein
MESARALLDRCNAHEPLSDGSVEIVSAMAREWRYLRDCRHAELGDCIKECAAKTSDQVCIFLHVSLNASLDLLCFCCFR